MKIALFSVALFISIAYFFATRKSGKNFERDIPYGPFTIRAKVGSSRDFNMNYGMVDRTSIAYTVLFKGKAIEMPGDLQNNTGLPYMWNVYVLGSVEEPMLIVGSQSLYLIYIKDGVPVVEALLKQSQDFASLQFLDSDKGQPGPFIEVFAESDTNNIDPLKKLEGGRYLMVGEQKVLDVQTRDVWSFHVGNEPIDNYSFPSPHGALAFSPDKNWIVFLAEFQSWNSSDEDLPESEHALIAYDFKKDTGYSVKFDDTETRLINIQEANLDWFHRLFEWKEKDGAIRLQRIPHQKPEYWTGRYKSEDGYYTLFPVKPGILPVFLDFVLKQMNWTKAQIVKEEFHEYTGRCIDLASGETKLDLRFKEDEQSLSFSSHLYKEKTEADKLLIQKIAAAFDAELKAGKHQEHFGKILSETKKIRGLYKLD
ncbi:MAG: hypothetical protein IPM92_04260 [Saprospiraceae bacterium]|nr:hypothetical protein [Saprospiraceae bacterium]